MAILPGGSCWSFCCCAAVLGVIVLKPEATSMLSLLCVLVWVVAQPSISANSAMALIILNVIRICFMFWFLPGLWLEMNGELSWGFVDAAYRTLVQLVFSIPTS